MAATSTHVVGIVADGLGSCLRAHDGADAAVTALEIGVQDGTVDPTDADQITERALNAVLEAGGQDPGQVRTTLTVVAVETIPCAGAHQLTITQIGDSPAILLDPITRQWTYPNGDVDDQERVNGDVAGQEPVNVVNAWLPERAVPVQVHVPVPAGTVVVAATDGLSVPLGDGTTELGQRLADRWGADHRPVAHLLIDMLTDFHHDDRTVILMHLPESSADQERAQSADQDAVGPVPDQDPSGGDEGQVVGGPDDGTNLDDAESDGGEPAAVLPAEATDPAGVGRQDS